jgi:hypothetical protein
MRLKVTTSAMFGGSCVFEGLAVFAGLALAASELPVELLEQHGLSSRLHDRGGEAEIRFLLRSRERVLPVWLDGRLQILRWGNRRGQSQTLPYTAWTWRSTLEAGGWAERAPVAVVIPASLGLDGGVWFHIREGIRGVVVRDERGLAVVYVLCEPASHYYEVMVRGSTWMPVLVGELI